MPTPKDRDTEDGGSPPGDRPTKAKIAPSGGGKKKPGREDRLAEALRANLRRRKAGGNKDDKDA